MRRHTAFRPRRDGRHGASSPRTAATAVRRRSTQPTHVASTVIQAAAVLSLLGERAGLRAATLAGPFSSPRGGDGVRTGVRARPPSDEKRRQSGSPPATVTWVAATPAPCKRSDDLGHKTGLDAGVAQG